MSHQVIHVLEALCDRVSTPVSEAVRSLARAGEWAKLQELRVRPSDYSDGLSYWKDALVVDLLRKCDLPTDVDKEAVAVRTFWACEAQNYRTNERLTRFLDGSQQWDVPSDEHVAAFISLLRKEVGQVVGTLPLTLTPRFSQGATYADTGKLTTAPDKMSSRPTITSGARVLLPIWERTMWCRGLVQDRPLRSDPRTVRGNIFFSVPKDGKTNRGCAKEPSINVGYQLDVGEQLKVRLKETVGIDLRDGQEEHRALAKRASLDGSLSTIDMSNASDTLCVALVQLCFRTDWYELLLSLIHI